MTPQKDNVPAECCTKAGAMLHLGLGGNPAERCATCGCTAQQILDDPTTVMMNPMEGST